MGRKQTNMAEGLLALQIDRRLYKKSAAGEEGEGEEKEESKEEDSMELMARLTKHIYNFQGVDNDRWVGAGGGELVM